MLTNYHMHPCPSFIRPVGKTRTELWSGLWTGLDRPFFYGDNFFVFVFVLFCLFGEGGGGSEEGVLDWIGLVLQTEKARTMLS